MIYNLQNEFEAEKFRDKVKSAMLNKSIVELKVRSRKRTYRQGSYLHLLIDYFATQYGCTSSEVKVDFYKKAANSKIYYKDNDKGNKVLRSTTDLTTEEMSLSIDRFRNWSSAIAGIYLPAPEEHAMLLYAEQEIERVKEYV